MAVTDTLGQVTTAHLGDQGQMILPKNFLESHHLDSGARITVIEFGNQLILVPEQARFTALSDSISQTLEQAGITEDELQAGLEGIREEVARERYPDLFPESATAEERQ